MAARARAAHIFPYRDGGRQWPAIASSRISCTARARRTKNAAPCFPSWPAKSPSRQRWRSEEHTSELQSLMRNSYAVFCLKKKKKNKILNNTIVSTNCEDYNAPIVENDKKYMKKTN